MIRDVYVSYSVGECTASMAATVSVSFRSKATARGVFPWYNKCDKTVMLTQYWFERVCDWMTVAWGIVFTHARMNRSHIVLASALSWLNNEFTHKTQIETPFNTEYAHTTHRSQNTPTDTDYWNTQSAHSEYSITQSGIIICTHKLDTLHTHFIQ